MLQRTGVRCVWLTKNKKQGEKMTPNDMATSISGIVQTGDGNITASTNFTYTFERMDDSNTWDR